MHNEQDRESSEQRADKIEARLAAAKAQKLGHFKKNPPGQHKNLDKLTTEID